MKININSKAWANILSALQPIAKANNVLPITECVKITAFDRTNITATDLHLTMIKKADVVGETIEQGECCVPVDMLLNTLKAMGDQNVQLHHQDNALHIKAKKGKYKIATMPAKNFPVPPQILQPEILTIHSTELQELLSVSVCASTDELRPTLTGVYIHSDKEGCKAAATDAVSLAVASSDASFFDSGVIIPKAAVKPLQSLTGDIEVMKDESHIYFHDGSTSVECRLIDGKFPKYQAIIPASERKIIVNRSELLNALNLSVNFADANTKQVVFECVEGVLKISSHDVNTDKASDQTVDIEGNLEKCSFNAAIMLKLLKLFSDDMVHIHQASHNKAHFIKSDNSDIMALVMPLAIV